MKRWLAVTFAILTTAAAVVPVRAQMVELMPGLTEAESAPLLPYFTGSGWAQIVDGAYSVMESSEIADSVSFTVSGGAQLVIYRELLAADSAVAEVCIDGGCETFTNSSSADQRGVPIAYAVADESEVEITNTDGGLLRIDAFLLIAPSEVLEVAAPDPSRAYSTLADGSIAAIDRTLSGGEVVLIALAAVQAGLLLILIVVTAWRR